MDLSALSALAPRLLAMLGLLLASAYFAGSETALFSLSRVQRERLARSERSADRYMIILLKDPRRLIATILLGNELINITFSSMAAGVAGRVFSAWGEIAVIAATTCITVPTLLVLGEITPKSIALRTAEAWGRFTARPLGLFALALTPVRIVVNGISGVVVRILGGNPEPAAPRAIGEDEFKALVDVGSKEGSLEAAEHRLIHNVFAFGDRTVAEIMTPARKVFSLSFDLPLVRMAAEAARSGFSRIPIYRGRRENIVGILFAKDLVGHSTGRLSGKTVKDLLRTPVYVPKTTKCDSLFREFQRTRTHMALVVDEYGRLAGLVTMEDLLEELFGETKEEKQRRAQTQSESGGTGEVPKVDGEAARPAVEPMPEPTDTPPKGTPS